MNDNKRKLYDALSQEYDMGTFEQFSTDIEDEAKRRKLYESIKGTYDLPDFNGFSSQLGVVAAQPQPTEQKQEVKSVGDTVVKPVVPTFTEQQLDSMEHVAQPTITSDTTQQLGAAYKHAADVTPERVAPDVDAEQERAKEREAELQEAYAERERLEKELEPYTMRQASRIIHSSTIPGGYAGGHSDEERADMKKHDALLAAKRQLDERIETLEESRDKNTSGFWRNLWRTVTNPSTWSFGLIPLNDALVANDVANKLENDTELNEQEETMLQQMVMNEEAKQKYGDDKGFMARAGTITGEALPFVAEFLLTDGFSGVAHGVSSATTKGLAKMTATDLSKKGLRSWLVKSTGTVAGDVAGATLMANTTGAAKTASDAMERHRGSIIQDDNGDYHFGHYEQDEDGNPVFVDGGKTWAQSIYEAEAANTLEYYTEMLGTHMEKPLGAAGSWIAEKAGLDKAGAYMVKKLGLGEVSKDLSQVTANGYGRAMKHVLERGGIQDYPSEVLEEEANIILNSMFVGDNSLSDLVDGRTQADIWGGMLFSVGFMNSPAVAGGTVDAASYLRTKHSMDNAERLASYRMTEDRWKPLRERIDGTSNEDFADLANEILADEDMHIEEKKAVLKYMGQLAKFRGFNVGSSAKAKDEVENPSGEQQGTVSRDLNTSYIGGYEANDEQLNDIKNGYEFQRQRLSAIVDDDYLQSFDNDPVNTLVGILSDGNSWTDEEKQTSIDYVNAKAAYDGMIHRVQDDIDGRIAMSDAMIESRQHHDDGMIHPATMKTDDRKVYVIGGKLVMNEDGTMIDHDQSDESVIIRDAATGAIEFADPHDVLSTDEALDAAQEKEAAQEAIRQQYAQQAANTIDGVLPFNDGDTYTATDEQGQPHTVVVVPNGTANSQGQILQAGEGEVLVSWDGAEPAPMSREVIQDMVENTNLARLQQFEQEKAERRAAEAEAEREASLPVYNINDEVTLQTEEGQVRGSITAEANEDGLIEVWTESPIGGKKINLYNRDQLDGMVVEHNGAQQTVEPPSEEPQGTVTPATDAQGTVVTTEELQPTGEAAGTMEAVEPMPMVGEGEDAEPDFSQVEPTRAHTYIYNEAGLSRDEANQFVEANKKAADKELEKIHGKKPKMGTSLAKYRKETAEWEQNVDVAQQKADYWKQVKDEQARIVAAERAAQSERDAQLHDQAVIDEQTRQAEELRKREEQAQLGTNAVAQPIRDRWQAAPKVEGAQNEIVLANGEKVQGRYMLVESGAATPSHNPRAEFTKNEGFPVDANGQSVNDRDYERDQDAQQTTRQIASVYDQRALQTPVVVSQDGVVLSGNGRTMAGELAAQNGTDGAYIEHLKKYGQQFGFTPEQVEGMQHPRVLFVPDESMPYTAETFAKFNAQEMKGQSKTEQAVKLGKIVDDDTFSRVVRSINAYETLGEFYADPSATTGAINELRDSGAISQAQYTEMFDGDGISAQGREILENMLIGKAFESNPDAVRQITAFKGVRQGIITALGEISNNLMLGRDYSHESELAQAINLVYQARQNGYKQGDKVSGFARQQNLFAFDEGATVSDYTNATVLMYADLLNEGRPTLLKKALALYNQAAQESANGQMDIFSGGVKTQDEILNDVRQLLKYGTEEEQQAALAAAAAERMAAAIPTGERTVTAASIQTDGSTGTEHQGSEATRGVVDSVQPAQLTDESEAEEAALRSRIEELTDEETTEDTPDGVVYHRPILIDGKHQVEQIDAPDKKGDYTGSYYVYDGQRFGGLPEVIAHIDGKPSTDTTISRAEREVNTSPTPAQKEAGNYKKGHVKIDGFDVTIENPRGSERSGTDASGREWRQTMHNTYGYIRGTEGVDGDHIDVFISDTPESGNVYVIDQRNADGSFDEHKVMYGFNSAEEARQAYLSNYEDGWQGLGAITEVSKDEFKKWVDSSHRKTKPFAEYKSVKTLGDTQLGEGAAVEQQPMEQSEEPQPIGHGAFGNIYDQFRGKAKEAIAFLLQKKEGEATGALHHKDIGDIDLVWGEEGTGKSDGFGLAKLVKYHPEVLDNLQEILDDMHVTQRSENRVRLESDTHQAAVRLTWDNQKKNWLLTAFEKKNSVLDNTTDTGETSLEGKRNDTATPQNTVSEGKGNDISASEQGNAEKSAIEPEFEARYQISPKPYTTKRGKVLDMQLIKFGRELSKEEQRAANKLAKDLKGWWSKEDGGFLMRDVETAQQLADSILDPETMEDAQPMSLAAMTAATDIAQTQQPDDTHAAKPQGTVAATPTGETSGTSAEAETQATDYGANNSLVSRDRYEELKRRMRKKMGGQLNMGIDPEILAIGTEMAAFHIEAGARKFAEYAKHMIEDLGDAIRPYLKAFYNGARELPEVEDAGYSEDMTPYDEVKRFDVANFDKPIPDAMATAEQVVAEREAEEQAEQAQQQLSEQRNDIRRSAEESTVGRPLKEADLEDAHPIVYYQGKPYGIIAVTRSGEQISATQFSKPKVDNIVLTNGKSVKMDELTILDDAGAINRIREIAQRGGQKSGQKRAKSKKKDVPLQQEPDLFGSFGEDATHVESQNDNSNGHARTDAVRSEGLPADGNQQGEHTERRSQASGQEGERAERGREVRGNGSLQQGLHDGLRPSDQLNNTPTEKRRTRQPLERPNNPKNTHNNHAERGKDYAPRGVDARIDANIKAIELMKQLMDSGEQATPEQMAVLRQFSGWGGLGKAFNPDGYQGGYRPDGTPARLRALLGEEAYQQANMSRNSAYYTPANVIDALWDVVRAMGFKGGRVLEGSAGIGNILGLMPTDMSERSDIHAVEIDQTTGNILSLLYPDAKVDVQGFEATQVENGSVDLAITNVPFVPGMLVPKDTSGDSDLSRKFRNSIQDFCIAKNVRKLREGGIGIFITSRSTLDDSARLREWVIQEGGADVVGAFRLNNETFGGTGATSDIIVIRKRVNGKKSPHAIDVLSTTGERTAEYDTGETKKVKGEEIPIIKQLSMDYNSYFVEHPEMMGGEMHFNFEMGETRYPTSRSLFPVKGKNQADMLKSWSQSFDGKDWGEVATVSQLTEQAIYEELGEGVKEGSMVVSNGQLCIAQRGKAVPLAVNANKVKGHSKVECFEAYQGIKKALSDLLQYQTDVEDDSGLQPLLKALNKAYDDFVKTYGHLHKNTSISFLKSDVDFANILALEKFSERGDVKTGKRIQEFGKTDIFSQRVVEKEKAPEPTNVQDGIIASIYVHGRVDVPWIVEQLNRHGGETAMHTEEEVKAEIVRSGLGFENPVTRQMEVSYEYLSGNVREKLAQAQANNADGQYDANIKALEAVVPMDIPAHLIDFSIGSSWIDPKLYEEYVKEKTDIDVTFTSAGGTWFMRTPYSVGEQKNRAMGVVSELLHKTIMGTQLIEAAMQNKTITVSETHKKWDGSTETITDKEATQACSNKIDEIRQDFKEWARAKMQSDPAMSERIERIYNDMFNNYVPRAIPDEFVPAHFGGAATTVDGKPFSLRPHQGKAVIRGTMQPLLLAHEVGSGKTYTLISTAMEMRRLGTARKPMIVVQNATVGQVVESAKKLYPNAKVLTLEDKDHTGEGRKNFYAKIKYNDWDMIVVPQSVFERIPDSEERQMKFVQDKIEEKMLVLEQMRDADPDSSSWIVKQAEKEINKLEDELAGLTDSISSKRKERDEKKEAVTRQNAEVKALEMLDRQTDDVEDFDDMGIDAILVDEAHEYKHLGFATAMQRGVKGVDPSYSKKAQGVYLKTQAVLEKNNGRNVIFATGTPISNTAAEIWTFMRYLMPADMMKEYGIYYFDDFVRNFGNLQQMLEFTTSGKFKEVNRFAGYVNLPELVRIWAGVADTVLNEDVEKQRIAEGGESKIPAMESGKAIDIYLPQTRALRSVMKYVKKQLDDFDKMSGKDKKANSHIPLTMYGIAKAAAVDARLVVSDAADEPQSKTNEAVRQTLRSLRETESYSGTVALFADNYQNKRSGFNLYEDIREKLIAQGVPAEQIVVMKSGMSVKKKLEIFDKVNRGEVRVIMGSTFTLGTGVNIQERLHTLIHLDAPNRPMDYTQRNGRILRQGNLHKEMAKPVRVLRFGVEDSLDVTAYQRLKTKGAIADSIMNGKQMMSNSMENRALEEEEDVFGDTVAQLSGSEYAMLKNQAEKDVRKYEAKKKQYQADQTYCHNEIPRLEGEIRAWKERLDKYRKNLAIVEAVPQHTEPSVTVGKQTFPSIEAMADFIKEYNKSIKEAENDLRDNPSLHSQTRRLTVNVGGIDFVFTTEQNVETKEDQGTLFSAVRRKMTYSCEALGLTDVPVHQSLLREGLEDIVKNVISGQDFREGIERSERIIDKNEKSLAQVRERHGKPFEFEKELEQAHERFDEYSELMKKELEEKEKKYAEMDADVEEASDISEADEADDETEDEDSDVHFRDGEDDVESINEQFNKELQMQIDGTLPQGHIYDMGMPSDILLSTGIANVPIQLNSTRLESKSSQFGHDFALSEIKDLVKAINDPVAIFAYGDKEKAQNIIVEIQKEGNNFVVGLSIRPSVNGRVLEVNSIRNVFPKKNAEWLNWINQGKLLYVDKEKIQNLINQQRTILADVEYLDLDSAAKVVENFENPKLSEENLRFRIREDVPPRKTGIGYKVFVLKDGQLYPPMVANPDGAATPTGVWLDADAAPVAGMSKTGRAQVKAGGKGTQGGSGTLAYRPGWHLGTIPYALQFNRKNPETGERDLFPANFVWAEVEYANDVDYQQEAHDAGVNANGKYQHSLAGLKRVPVNGSYMYRTNPNPETDPWIITGAMKVKRILKPSEVDAMVKAAGREPQQRQDGYVTDGEIEALNKEIDTHEREGEATKRLTYEESLAMSRRAGYTKKQHDAWQERAWRHMHEAAESTVERLGLGGRVTILETPDGLKGRKAKAKGWFDAKTGKIVVVLGNHHSVSDVVKTILHEGVAHYGLRKLFGQHFDQFLDNVYQYGDESVRREIVELAKKHGWDFREATEEYIARLAEDTDFERATNQGWWSKIKSLFLDMLHHIGLGDYGGAILTNNELRYILWRSYENMAEPGRYRNPFREAEDISMQMRLGVGSFDRERARIHSLGRIDSSRQIAAEGVAEGDGKVLFRDGDFSERDRAIARDRYEKMVSEGLYQFQEAVQDSMLGLKKLYDAILSPKGKVHMEDVEGYENAYLAENRMSSVNAAEQHDYYLRFMQPLLKAIGSIAGNKKGARQALTDYMMAKHGLERNRVFAERDAREVEANGGDFNDAYQKFREKDYSGLTALTGEDDVVAAEAAAQQIVDDYEAAYDTADLWDRTREATQATLEKIYRSGLLSKERYEQIRDMFEYYIPLQGWDETTSDEVYGYLTSKSGPFGGSPIKHAVGRSSKADDPIATIAMMADAAIRQGNRNLMKQRFLNFVLNHPSDLVSVHDLWLEYDAATDEWIPVFADLEDGDTAADVERKVEAFEQRMEQLAEAEPDRYKRGRDAQSIPYKVVKGNLKEHQVLVKRGGRTYVLTINGNPRAAQALNGLTNPDVEQGGVVGNMLKAGEWVNRHLSAFYTTRNPDFVVSNFFRDMLYSNCMTWVKESPRYALRYHKNFGRLNPAKMRVLLDKWEHGTLDMSNPTEHLFYQFMMNGGETGYTSVRDIEEHKREIAKELKKQGSMSRKAWSALGMQLDLLNRSVENCARFAAFVTSREMGRSIDRSIYDAKEVSVNFNKKGSGGKMVNATGQTLLGKVGSYVGGGGRLAYVFWNAGVQGLTNFGRAGKRHGGKAFAGAATMFILGYVIPQLAAAMGGGDGDDDDKNAYYNLPEYVRRSNICFRVGDQWVTIPLPIEFRSIYGLGELASGVISGNEHYDNKELSWQIVGQMSQILPLDMLEGGGGVSPWIPSTMKPFTEAYVMNKGWTGLPVYKDTPWNQNDPEWTKAYKNTDQTLVSISKGLNELGGGDDFKKSDFFFLDINPAKLEYLLSGVFGGYVNTAEKLKKMGETALGNREFDWRNMLLANRVVKTGDERTANRKLQNEYFKYKKEYEETSRLLRKYEDAADEGIAGMAEKVDFLYNSKEYMRYELFDEYKADIDDYREDLQETTDEGERKEIEAEMYATMRELIDLLHETE